MVPESLVASAPLMEELPELRRLAESTRYNEHQQALADHPAVTVFQEHQLHPLITVRPKLAVIRRIQIQERASFRQHPALKNAAVDGGDSFSGGCRGPVCIEFNAGQVGTSVHGDLKQGRTVAGTRIDGRVRRRGHEQGADVLGFLHRQGIVTEFEATSISHFFLHRVRLFEGLLEMRGSHTASGSPLATVAQVVDRSMVQFGKGFLLEVLKPSISWRTMLRRSNKHFSKRCSSARSPYHSQGISSATP